MTRKTETLRNVGIIAHVDAGKTTLTERILHRTGEIHRSGEVHHGNTTTDFGVEEQKMGITISAAAVSCAWRDTTIQLIDTPGHADFTIEVERSLRVLDGAVLLLDAVAGVEPQTEKVWRQAKAHDVSAIAFINKLDRAGADFDRALNSLREKLDGHFVVLQRPIGAEDSFEGLIDLVERRGLVWEDAAHGTPQPKSVAVPESLRAEMEDWRARLVEQVAEVDEELLERFVHDPNVDAEALKSALRRCTLNGSVIPVLAGSAFRHRGVEPLLDALVDYLPAPHEKGLVRAADSGETRMRNETSPLAALCFKVAFDRHAALCFVRVYSGALVKGQSVAIGGTRKTLRVGRMVRLFADQQHDVDELRAGEIGALLGAEIATGNTLCDVEHPLVLERVEAPPAVMRMAIEAQTTSDRERLPKALSRLLLEDPSLRLEHNAQTGQTTLAGMGRLHLEVAASRLKTLHKVSVDLGEPRVAYRETLSQRAEVQHRHIKQSGGPGQFAVLTLSVEPCEPEFEFVDETRGGVLLREYVRGVEKGCRAAMTHGVLGGYPLSGVRVRLLDGAMHSNDSNEHVFEVAAAAAFHKACAKASPVFLEPIMELHVHVPSAYGGAVIGDISARRGQVLRVDAKGEAREIEAKVPLSELFSYAATLGGLSSGRGGHSMSLAEYAAVPAAKAVHLMSA